MNYKIILLVGICGSLLLFQSCGGEKVDRPSPVLTQDQVLENQSKFETPTIPSGAPITGGVDHYTCPNGHPGSSAQGTCATCGSALVHNQAFHNQTPGQTPAPEGEPPQNAAGIWHYTCPNGHAGGAGSAVACAECGTTLVHNTTYHSTSPTATPAITPAAPGDPSAAAPPPTTAEPPQNAAGVWHYTCPNGHAGGSGSATACGECGATLAHNSAYHN